MAKCHIVSKLHFAIAGQFPLLCAIHFCTSDSSHRIQIAKIAGPVHMFGCCDETKQLTCVSERVGLSRIPRDSTSHMVEKPSSSTALNSP